MAKVFFENYGCQMNTAEIDSLKSQLSDFHHIEVDNPEDANVVIMNTCAVRTTAEQRIKGRLGFYRNLRENEHQNVGVVLTGCVSQHAGEALQKDFPDVVKLVWGTYQKQNMLSHLDHLEEMNNYLEQKRYEFMPSAATKEYPFKAFLPISHGCNHACTYCIVPSVRGKEINRPYQEIVDNAKKLVDDGVLEITLLGQNIDSYHDSGKYFHDLLDEIASKSGIKRLLFLTSHPKDLHLEVIDCMSEHKNILNYLHLPIQSGNDHILKRMGRLHDVKLYLEKYHYIQKHLPNLVFSTDIIVGFPGETEEEFLDTLHFMSEIRYNEAFMYYYNPRPSVAATKMPDQVPLDIKLDRLDRLIMQQNKITPERIDEQLGEKTSILIDRISKKNPNELLGRTHKNTACLLKADPSLIGTIQEVEITGRSGNMLLSKLLK